MDASSVVPFIGMHTVVEVLQNDGEWYVRVIADGRETINCYQIMASAIAYAERERVRLVL